MTADNPFDFDSLTAHQGSPASTTSSFHLTEEEIKSSEELAANGNIKGMLKLHLFYEMSALDEQKSLKWLLMAAEAGDLESQYSVAISYLNARDLDRAQTWAHKAQENGHAHAKDLITSIEKHQK